MCFLLCFWWTFELFAQFAWVAGFSRFLLWILWEVVGDCLVWTLLVCLRDSSLTQLAIILTVEGKSLFGQTNAIIGWFALFCAFPGVKKFGKKSLIELINRHIQLYMQTYLQNTIRHTYFLYIFIYNSYGNILPDGLIYKKQQQQ